MRNRKRRALTVLILVAVLFSVLAPAAYARGRVERFFDRALFRPRVGAQLEAGGVTVVVPPYALNGVRLLGMKVVVSQEMTDVNLGPKLEFAQPALIDFGTTPVVYYWGDGRWLTVYTIDADQDGEVGEIYTNHFSRWAWW